LSMLIRMFSQHRHSILKLHFEAAFDGSWKESESGEWMTSHTSHVIKVVLTLLYTGKIDNKLVEKDPLAFVSIASEYDLARIKSLAESCCIDLVNGSIVIHLLQAAHLYDCSVLEKACAEYVKKNALAVLQNAEIMNLKTENPDIWDELWKAIEHSVNLRSSTPFVRSTVL
jgi:BTB And C-terminal Kelch